MKPNTDIEGVVHAGRQSFDEGITRGNPLKMQQLLMQTLVRRFLARKLCIQQLQISQQQKTWRVYYWWMLGMACPQGYKWIYPPIHLRR
jgi:hypothetical protein